MNTAYLENTAKASPASFSSVGAEADASGQTDLGQADALLETGVWLSGIDAFVSSNGRAFATGQNDLGEVKMILEFRIIRMALQRCAHSIFALLSGDVPPDANLGEGNISVSQVELSKLASAVREELLRCESINRLDAITAAEWRIFHRSMLDRLRSQPAYLKLTGFVDADILENLPSSVLAFSSGRQAARSALFDTMARFGRILTVLNVIERMLERDEPLKPAVLVFAKAQAMTLNLIEHLNRTVAKVTETDRELAESLDGAAYAAAIEMKKAVAGELAGLVDLRSATGVYARTEAAYSLLAESFQQTLTLLARHIDPSADMFAMFPNFARKREHSIRLRAELYAIAELARAAETKPDKQRNEKLNSMLRTFSDGAIRHLFFKDIETFERFIEEIRVARRNKDMIAILHRFGAYLDTLFAQVNMRAVLEKHPFDAP